MALLFKVTITMPDGSKGRMTRPFADSLEAVSQVMADYPEAVNVSAICLGRVRALSVVGVSP